MLHHAWMIEFSGAVAIQTLGLIQNTGTGTGNDTGALGAAPAAEVPGKTASDMSLFGYIASGGVVGWMILCLSIVAVALIIMHFLNVRRNRLMPPTIVEQISQLSRGGKFPDIADFCERPENDCFYSRVVGPAVRRCLLSPFGMMEIRTALEESAQHEVDKVYRTTDGIGLIAALGPMLGLLGTTIGMIGAFGTIGKMEGATKSAQLADFMSIALVTTAMGLFVAIPCTAAYTLCRRRIESLMGEATKKMEPIATLAMLHADRVRAMQKTQPAAPQGGGR
jgi:biopolymer transport protein ExbB